MTSDDARAFAVQAHADQRYGDQPYSVHLDAVAALATPYGDQSRTVAYLHDVVEDTGVPIEVIRERFGNLVADCVAVLTDAPGANRKERKARTYARMAQASGPLELALVVKAADRLANVRACVANGRQSMWDMYRGEHPAFREAAWRDGLCDPLWQELDALLSAWPAVAR